MHILGKHKDIFAIISFPDIKWPRSFESFVKDKKDSLSYAKWIAFSLQWRHNGRDGVSNHQHRDCLLNRLFRRRSKKTSKLRSLAFCAGNSPGIGEFPAQRASNAENVSIWWRHHVKDDLAYKDPGHQQPWYWPSSPGSQQCPNIDILTKFTKNWHIPQIPQCTCPISHNTPFCINVWTFLLQNSVL